MQDGVLGSDSEGEAGEPAVISGNVASSDPGPGDLASESDSDKGAIVFSAAIIGPVEGALASTSESEGGGVEEADGASKPTTWVQPRPRHGCSQSH